MTGDCTFAFEFEAESSSTPSTTDEQERAERWECPHDTHADTEYCLFHLDIEERRARGIDSATVADAFQAAVEQSGPRTKQFVGATFDELDLSFRILESSDNHEIDLREVTVTRTLDLTEVTSRQKLRLGGAEIDTLLASNAEFDRAVSVAGSTLRTAVFREATFDGDLDMTEATIDETAVFDEVRLNADACFQSVGFAGPASFQGAEFHGDANMLEDDVTFEDAVFESHANFTRAEAGFAVFRRTEFRAETSFDEVRITGDAQFTNAVFEETASFRGAEFHGDAKVMYDDVSFEGATFNDRADFTLATFEDASFEAVRFTDDVTFEDAVFGDDASFDSSTFAGRVAFQEARFYSDVSFADSEFGGPALYTGAEFHGGDNANDDDATFVDASFEATADFELTEFRSANFTRAGFHAAAVFRDATFVRDAEFRAARFAAEATFLESRFQHDTDFSECVFCDDVSFSGAEFQGGDNVDDEDLTFAGATFGGEADFHRAEFEATTFLEAAFEGALTLDETQFARDADFTDATFAGPVSMDEARFQHDVSFEAASFETTLLGRGVEFQGGDNVDDDDLTFADAEFGGEVDLQHAWFAHANFSGTVFHDLVTFRAGWFDDTLIFDEATFLDQVEFTEARFDHDATFTHVTFEAAVTFRGAEFHGGEHTVDDADFRDSTFNGHADFSLVEFRTASFKNAAVNADLQLSDTSFSMAAWFDGMTVQGDLDFENARFGDSASFTDTTFEGTAEFDQVIFENETTFARARFAASVSFRSTEFRGDANIHDDDATFDGATFDGEARFRGARFQYATFTDVTFGGRADFRQTRFRESVEIEAGPASGVGLVDMERAQLAGGTIAQPASGSMFYDLTEAVVGDVTLLAGDGDRALFEHFRFCNTEFDNFDFTRHKSELARDNWVIHGWDAPAFEELDSAAAVTDHSTLESTYLKAKNSAAEFGDRKAAAEFFIKEMAYRRRKNGEIALGRGRSQEVPVRSRLRAAGKWLGNAILYQTCGYGERLWRVVYVSGVAIVIWAFLYATMTEGTEGASGLTNEGLQSISDLATPEGVVIFGKNLYFSMVTFTTLGYGDIQPVGMTARTLAGLESFFGALLVALVVFVLGRRVAW